METVLGFLTFLLLELPARVIALYPAAAVLVITLVAVIVFLVLVRARGGSTKT